MKLSKWDPFREMEAVLDRYRASPAIGNHSTENIARADWYPTVDVSETDGAYHVHAELPGVKKEDISVTVNDGVLKLSGHRESRHESDEKKIHRIERSYGSFSRSFSLPENVLASEVEANFQDGVIEVDIPKSRQEAPKQVNVKVS